MTNSAETSTAPVTVTVDPTGAPLVNHITPITVVSGTPVSINASATGRRPFTFTFTQTGGTPTVLPVPSNLNPLNIVPVLPLGTAVPAVFQFQVVATDANLVPSAPEFFTVTVNPQPDTITITVVEYRTTKDRLTVTATSSVISQALVLTLQPYISINGGAPRTRAA